MKEITIDSHRRRFQVNMSVKGAPAPLTLFVENQLVPVLIDLVQDTWWSSRRGVLQILEEGL